MERPRARTGGEARGSGWDAPAEAERSLRPTGNHSASTGSRGPFDAAFTVLPDPAERTEAARDETSPGLSRQHRNPRPAAPAGTAVSRRPGADGHRFGHAAGGRTGTGARRHRTDPGASGRRPDVAGTDGFLGQPAASSSADLQLPAPRAAREPAIARPSWPAAAELATTSAAETSAGRTTTPLPGTAAAAQPPQLGAAPQLGPAGRLGWTARAGARQRAEYTAARTGSSRCDCWRSSSSPRSSAARWCCCLSNVPSPSLRCRWRRTGRCPGSRRTPPLRHRRDRWTQRIDEAGPGDSGGEHGAQGVGCRRMASAQGPASAAWAASEAALPLRAGSGPTGPGGSRRGPCGRRRAPRGGSSPFVAGSMPAAAAASPPPKALATDRSAVVTSLGMTQNVLPAPCASCGSVCRYW